MRVGADHEFHDEAFARGWADRFVPTPERMRLFDTIAAALRAVMPFGGVVVELGIGPGYLAAHLLARLPGLRYIGLDFSEPMLGLARERLVAFEGRVDYRQADLVTQAWWSMVPQGADGVVSTWALHDLGDPEHTRSVYAASRRVLRPGGVFLNGDFVKPDGTPHAYERGRFEVSTHLRMLAEAGYRDVECLAMFEPELKAPTAAQNYACLKAVAGN
jgi:SAM-dependent methyltransferase